MDFLWNLLELMLLCCGTNKSDKWSQRHKVFRLESFFFFWVRCQIYAMSIARDGCVGQKALIDTACKGDQAVPRCLHLGLGVTGDQVRPSMASRSNPQGFILGDLKFSNLTR